MTGRRIVFALLLSLALGAAACGAPPRSAPAARPAPTPTSPPTAQPATDEEAIRQLIALEGEGVVRQDIAGLAGLWAEDAVVVDARHTPGDASDDARWSGRDAIRERYVVLVFPGAPAAAGAKDVALSIEGDTATATSTTAIGGESSPLGDRWTFVRRDGRWWIKELTYNLEPE
jgi:ketosteroid isomerase-like protein